MNKVTLADLQMKYGTALDKVLVNDVMPVAPLVKWLPSEVISGTSTQYRCVTSIPKVGPRPVNAGVDSIRANYELKRSQLFLYQGLIAIDEALAKADPSGEGGLMAEQAELVMQGAMFTLEQYAIYGKALGEDAMPGILDGIGNYMTISADEAHNTTESRQAGGASVLAIVGDPKMLRLQFGNSKAIAFSPTERTYLPTNKADGTAGTMPALAKNVTFWAGVSVRSEFAVARLINESASKPLTDALLAQLVSLFPTGVVPTALVMNRQTRARLQASRATALTYNKKQSGQTAYAELPTEFEGIPIICTDALIADETDANIAALAKELDIKARKLGTIER